MSERTIKLPDKKDKLKGKLERLTEQYKYSGWLEVRSCPNCYREILVPFQGTGEPVRVYCEHCNSHNYYESEGE